MPSILSLYSFSPLIKHTHTDRGMGWGVRTALESERGPSHHDVDNSSHWPTRGHDYLRRNGQKNTNIFQCATGPEVPVSTHITGVIKKSECRAGEMARNQIYKKSECQSSLATQRGGGQSGPQGSVGQVPAVQA